MGILETFTVDCEVDLFSVLCQDAVTKGLMMSAEEFEQEFAVRLDDSLNKKFLNQQMSQYTFDSIVVYLVQSSYGLIGEDEAKCIARRIFGQNTDYYSAMENNRLQ